MNPNNNSAAALVAAIGSLAEMSHLFYTTMLKSGASENEALVGMKAFIHAFWSAASKNKSEGNDDGSDE